MTPPLTDAEVEEIRARLNATRSARKPVPPCRVCGRPLVLGAVDHGREEWNCPGGDWRNGAWSAFDDQPGRSLADEHYARSEWSRPVGRHETDDIARLLATLDERTRERDELAATLANERGEGEPPSVGWYVADTCWWLERDDWQVLVERTMPTAADETDPVYWKPALWVATFKRWNGEPDDTRPTECRRLCDADTARSAMKAADAALAADGGGR
jgi:hypothetical protein